MTPDDDRFGEALEKLKRRLKINSQGDLLLKLLAEQPEFEGILRPGRGKRIKVSPEYEKHLKIIKEGWRNYLDASGQTWRPLEREAILRSFKIAHDCYPTRLTRFPSELLEISPEGATKRLVRLEKSLRAKRESLARALLHGQIKK